MAAAVRVPAAEPSVTSAAFLPVKLQHRVGGWRGGKVRPSEHQPLCVVIPRQAEQAIWHAARTPPPLLLQPTQPSLPTSLSLLQDVFVEPGSLLFTHRVGWPPRVAAGRCSPPNPSPPSAKGSSRRVSSPLPGLEAHSTGPRLVRNFCFATG